MAAKKKPKKYYCDVWKMHFVYFLGWDRGKFHSYIFEKFNYESSCSNGDASCLLIEDGGYTANYIWTRNKDDWAPFAHECVHAACNTLRLRGWIPDLNNEEPLAYLVENIFKQGSRQ